MDASVRGRDRARVRFAAIALAALLVRASPALAQTDTIPSAARDIPRGVELVEADIASDSASARRGAALVGWVTRRTIREGEPLREPAVSPPLLVSAGDEVQVVWSDGAMELRVKGRAMNSATAGGRVNVRVDTTRRFEGVAVDAGLVRLDSPGRSR